MRRFLRHFLTFAGCTFFATFIVFKSIPMANGVLDAYPEKRNTLKNTTSPKIVFIGGSNLAFGIDTERISRATGMNAYNMGMHAGIGIRFMFADIIDMVNAGDIVVACPEYGQFTEDPFYGEHALAYILLYVYPSGISTLNGHLGHIFPYLIDTFSSGICRIARRDSTSLEKKEVYSRLAFNNYGDITKHYGKPSIAHEAEKMAYPEKIPDSVISDLRALCHKVEEKGGRVVFLPPGLEAKSYDINTNIIEAQKKMLLQQGFSDHYDTLRYRFDNALFYDTLYHMTEEGIEKRTTLIIEDLRQILKPKNLQHNTNKPNPPRDTE